MRIEPREAVSWVGASVAPIAGVGAARSPAVWLRDGDLVEIAIPGVGLLGNPVSDE